MSLVEFLRARLDEDEVAAKAWLLFGNPDDAARAHVARHDPARVLAEVEAKRRLMEGHDGPSIGICQCNADCPCPTLRLLALPYADHASYRDEWKP